MPPSHTSTTPQSLPSLVPYSSGRAVGIFRAWQRVKLPSIARKEGSLTRHPGIQRVTHWKRDSVLRGGAMRAHASCSGMCGAVERRAIRGAGAAWPEAGSWARAPASQTQMESWHSGLHLEQKCGRWQEHMWPWTQPCLFRQNNDRDVCAKYHNSCLPFPTLPPAPGSRAPKSRKWNAER